MAPYLEALGIPCEAVQCAGRRDLLRAVRHVRRLCRRQRVDIVHAHFMDACLAGLTGARLAGVRAASTPATTPDPSPSRTARRSAASTTV